MAIVLSALVGTLLALCFRVFVLMPATILVLFVTAALDARAPLSLIALHMIVVATALQFGYLAGALFWKALHTVIPYATDPEETRVHQRGSGIFMGR
jgi:hypothetical protein